MCLCCLAIINAVEMGGTAEQRPDLHLFQLYPMAKVEVVCFLLPLVTVCLLSVQMYWRETVGA